MDNPGMITYKRHRFPPAIISYAVWLYHRFNLSHRDIEDLLAERGIAVSYEAIRLWCAKFGPEFTKRLRRNHQGYGDTLYNLFNLGRHLISANHYQFLRQRAFASWKNAAAL